MLLHSPMMPREIQWVVKLNDPMIVQKNILHIDGDQSERCIEMLPYVYKRFSIHDKKNKTIKFNLARSTPKFEKNPSFDASWAAKKNALEASAPKRLSTFSLMWVQHDCTFIPGKMFLKHTVKIYKITKGYYSNKITNLVASSPPLSRSIRSAPCSNSGNASLTFKRNQDHDTSLSDPHWCPMAMGRIWPKTE